MNRPTISRPITTGQPRIPTWQLIAISSPWAVQVYADNISGQPLTLTLSRFVSDPLLISFLSSLNILFNFLIGVAACYLSDRIWTPLGRRTPFLVAGFLGAALCLLLIPFMPSLLPLAAAIIAYQFFCDLYKPWEPLYNEVVPPPQRGRAQVFRLLMNGAVGILVSTVMLARFDSYWTLPTGHQLRGDVALYSLGALLLVATAAGLLLFVMETPPTPPPPPTPHNPLRAFLTDTFGSAHAWRVYILYLCPVLSLMGGGVATLWTLFQTRQLGLTAVDLAAINAWAAPISLLVFVPLLGLLADRRGGTRTRMALLRLGLTMPALVLAAVFLLSRTTLPITLPLLTAAAVLASLFQTMVWVVWGPLTFDYIPRDKMGTYTAGFVALSGIAGFLLANAAGAWVYLATRLQSPASIPTTRPGEPISDFSSVALLAVLTSATALAITFYFTAEEGKGRVARVGALG